MTQQPEQQFRKVLLIEDDEVGIFITKQILIFASFAEEIIHKSTYDNALEYLKNISTEEFPDVIILDMKMPDKEELGFLDDVHKLNEKIKKTFLVVILTDNLSGQSTDKLFKKDSHIKYHVIHKPITLAAVRNIGNL